jgi:lipoyl(octanoyl) transferase
VENWGLIGYQEAFAKQQQYVDEILTGERGETLVFCHHPPVVTLGRGTREDDVFAWTGETVQVNRGGRATYHGPNQVVFYPLIDLGGNTGAFIAKAVRSLHAYMRLLEDTVILTLKNYGVEAQGHSLQIPVGELEPSEATGVWIGSQKIASIGIASKKWVTSHGVAVNLFKDEQAFQGIHPCGFQSQTMTSLQDHFSKRIKREAFEKEMLSHFLYLMYSPSSAQPGN